MGVWLFLANTWNKVSASNVLVVARTHIKLAWPNGAMVAVGRARVQHNNKSIHCLHHSGGDNHLERAACCGDLTSLLERYLCWHSDPPLNGERRKESRCCFHLPWMARERRRSCQLVNCDVSTLLPKRSNIPTGMSKCPIVGSLSNSIDDLSICLSICY